MTLFPYTTLFRSITTLSVGLLIPALSISFMFPESNADYNSSILSRPALGLLLISLMLEFLLSERIKNTPELIIVEDIYREYNRKSFITGANAALISTLLLFPVTLNYPVPSVYICLAILYVTAMATFLRRLYFYKFTPAING